MAKLTAKNLVRFSITVAEANAYHIHIEDLAGITEIIPNKKYRIVISNGFKKDGSRHRISETFNGTLLQAIARKKDMKQEIEDSNISPDINSKFSEFTKAYCKYLEEKVDNNQLELTTYEGYYYLIEKRILPFFKEYIVKDINEKDVETWIATLQKTKTQKGATLHPTTIAHAFKVLQNMFNYGKLERIIRENPCEFVRKKPTEQPDEKEYFTLEEMDYIKELLLTTNIRLKTAMFLVMDTGCRREEIIGLKWKDIDFENNKIDINKAVVHISKRTPINNKRIIEKDVKSKNSKRKIGIPQVCADLLKQYKNFKKDSGLRVKDSDYVFTNWDSNKVWDPNRFTAEWNTFRKEHNIKKKVAIHGVRHSNATFLLSTGMPKKDVAKRLGHTPEVLDRTYTHSDEKDDDKIVAEIEKNFYGNKSSSFSTYAITSIIAGYVDNEYKNENYKLLDYLTGEEINHDNLNEYLESCQNYLLDIYPILDIFKDKNIVPNEEVFRNRLANYIVFLGSSNQVAKPIEKLASKKINL